MKKTYGINIKGIMAILIWEDSVEKLLKSLHVEYDVYTAARTHVPHEKLYKFETDILRQKFMRFKLGVEATSSFMKNIEDIEFLEFKE